MGEFGVNCVGVFLWTRVAVQPPECLTNYKALLSAVGLRSDMLIEQPVLVVQLASQLSCIIHMLAH